MGVLLSFARTLLASFGLRFQGQSRPLVLSPELLQQIRSLIFLVSGTFCSVLLLVLGVHYLVLRVLDQVDKAEFLLSNSILFLLVFNAACLASIYYFTNKRQWVRRFAVETRNAEPASQSQFPNIESAVSLFILDLIKERESKRRDEEKRHDSQSPPPQ